MEKGTHGKEEKSFEELDYAGQARTLNAQILGISKGIKAHLRLGISEERDLVDVKKKYVDQLLKIIADLK